jgi:TolB-like protein/class 3 adenylate cyclase
LASNPAERKLAAILAADVVGYSRLMGEDEAGTARAVREHREAAAPIVASHGGRLFKTMGDGMLLEFPSVVAAVECAIAIQKQMLKRNADVSAVKRILYRIGVNLGDLLIEGDDILGDGVNIASRLESIAAPGGVCVSGAAFDHVRGKIDADFIDLGERQLKNIARPVRVHALAADDVARASASAPAKAAARRRIPPPALLAGAALVLVIATGATYRWFAVSPAFVTTDAEAKHLSIVVLPFTNLSNDPAQDYFADGVTENLTSDLSRIRDSFVIARNTAFTYKGKNADAKAIGKELGVRYVLEGSVQRDKNRVRVNAELIDAESGAHLWADRFEQDVADLFELQDQVVARLGNALGFELVKAEAEKSAHAKNPDAIDLAMRGWAMMWRSYRQPMEEKQKSHAAALALFDRALALDSDDADALAGDAFTYMAFRIFGWPTAEADFDAKVIGQADRAIALAPDNMRAYLAKSYYLTITNRASDALRAADSGLAINPNYAPLLDARVTAETALGRYEQAKADAQQAMRLSPRDPEMATRHLNLGLAEIGLGRFDAAVVEFQNAIDAGDHSFIPDVNLAAAYALEGKPEETKSALAEARRLNPDLTVKWLADHAPNVPPLFEGVRKAGLAEQ